MWFILCVLFFVSHSSAFALNISCTDENSGRFYDDPSDCANYFVCFRGEFHSLVCPDGFHFHEAKQMCDYPINVGCNDTNATPPTCPPPTLPTCPPPTQPTCPTFPPTCPTCPTFPPTSEMTTPTEDTPTQPPRPSICPPRGLHKVPHPYSCSKYILCFDGVAVERLCSPGLYWNSELFRCVRRNDSDCLLPSACPTYNDPDDIIFIPGYNCTSYSICHNGKPVEFDCGEGFHFEPILNRCIFEEESKCEPLILPDIKEVECDPNNSTAYFVPHPDPRECQFYFVCIEGTSHLLKCANTLLFDPILLKCFFEDQVVCKKFP